MYSIAKSASYFSNFLKGRGVFLRPDQGSKSRLRLVTLSCLVIALLPSQVLHAEAVHIPDSNLRTSLEKKLGKSPGEVISEDEMASLTYLNLEEKNIEDLTGLETAVGLIRLYLSENHIVNLAPLASLTNLLELSLNENQIVDISPLENLVNLEFLRLYDNEINGLEHFPALRAPWVIWLNSNYITDISPLLKMVDVNQLELRIDRNLVDLSEGSESRAVIDELIQGGAEIDYLPQKEAGLYYYPDPLYISAYAGDTVSAEFVITNRGELELVYSLSTTDEWISIEKSEGAIPPRENHQTFFENIVLELGPLPEFEASITGTIRIQSNDPQDPSIELPVVASPPVTIPDANLRTQLEDSLNKQPGEPISTAEMETLTHFVVANQEVVTLEGLQTAVNLETLTLLSNNLGDLSQISGLTNLRTLGVVDNQLQDVSALAALTNLEELNLENNKISDIRGLEGLTGLQSLRLSNNEIVDITPLQSLSTMVDRPIILQNNHLDISEGSEARAVIDDLIEAGVWVYYSPQTIPDLWTWITKLEFSGIVGETFSTEILLGNDGINDLTYTINPDVEWIHASPSSGVLSYEDRTHIEVTIGPIPEFEDALRPSLVLSTNDPYSLEERITYLLTPEADIPDTTLYAILLDALGKNPGEPIAEAELDNLSSLVIINEAVESLSGLELATNLEYLVIDGNVDDLSPIAGLNKLTRLDIRNNPLSDLSPLQNLFRLEELSMSGNAIVDLSPIIGLDNLISLILGDNPLSDISLLGQLTGLETLYLSRCPIQELTSLASLTHLTKLSLDGCEPENLDPLAGLTELQELSLRETEISDLSALGGLINIHNLFLYGNQISDLTPLSGLHELEFLALADNQVSDLSPLSELTSLDSLYLDNNRITDLGPLEGLTQLSRLSLDFNYLFIKEGSPADEIIFSLRQAGVGVSHGYQMQPILEVSPTVLELIGAPGETIIGRFEVHNSGNRDLEFQMTASDPWIIFDTGPVIVASNESSIVTLEMGPIPDYRDHLEGAVTAVSNDPFIPSVSIPYAVYPAGHISDAGLLAAIRQYLGLPPESSVSAEQLATLTSLSYTSDGVMNLSGIEAAVNLERLDLTGKSIDSLFPIARLQNLENLNLIEFQINNLEPLAQLTGLKQLGVIRTWVRDISVLSNFDGLESLRLIQNYIVDISPIESLTKLERLFLGDNRIEDISSLRNMTELVFLDASDNKIKDVTPLSGLTKLKTLQLGSNEITDISPLQEITEVTDLSLSRNNIEDISALESMRLLNTITLGFNQISDLTPLAGLSGVTRFQVGYNNVYLGPESESRQVIDYYIAQGVPYIVFLAQNPPWLQLFSDSLCILASEGETVNVDLNLTNGRNLDLQYSIADSESWIAVNPDQGTIPPGGTVVVSVTLSDIPSSADGQNHILTITTDDHDYPERTVALQVLSERHSFETWATTMALPLDSRSAYDRNGPLNIQNILAYAMGIDPMTATSDQLPEIGYSTQIDTLFMKYHFNDYAYGIDMFFEASSDLKSWQIISPSEIQVLSDDGNGHQRVLGVFSNGSSYPFVRLRVELESDEG